MKDATREARIFARVIVGAGLASVVLGAIISLAPIYGPRVEAAIAPVLKTLPSHIERREDGAVWLSLRLDKLRGECVYIKDSATFQAGGDGVGWERLSYTRPGLTPGPSRGAGKQSFGWWRFESVQPGEQIRGVWRYECHHRWDTPATIGPWVAP